MYASAMPPSMPPTQMPVKQEEQEEEKKTINPFQQQEVNQSQAPSNEFDFFNDIASAQVKKQEPEPVLASTPTEQILE